VGRFSNFSRKEREEGLKILIWINFEFMFKLDKTVSKVTTLKEASADHGYAYWKTKSERERIEAAIYLIKTAYRISEFPKMDKTVYSWRRLCENG
jgi:hypothetical protein